MTTPHPVSVRQRLPNRRASETFTFEIDGLHFCATISRFKDGRIGEIFLASNKAGSQADTAARDSAVVASSMAPISKQSGGAFLGMAAVAVQGRWAGRSISLSSSKPPKQIRECRRHERRCPRSRQREAALMHEPLPLRTATAADIPRLQHVLHRDYETRSRLVLKVVGAHRYAADATTEVQCCAYAVDDGPVQLWRPGDPAPAEFIDVAKNPSWIVAAHNDAFEAAIEKQIMFRRHGWPMVPMERHRCTQAMCLALGLPARLSAAADALELANRKDVAGERLMHQTSKPRRPHKDEDPNQIYWFEDDDRMHRLYDYCRQDVEVERELYLRLPPLSQNEQTVWELSNKINARGFCVDRAFAEAARKIAEEAAPEIDLEVHLWRVSLSRRGNWSVVRGRLPGSEPEAPCCR
jgi:hypothetical protein